jgi:hypothetical protein
VVIRPLAWIVVGVLLVINIGVRLPDVSRGLQPPLVLERYGTVGAGTAFSLAFPARLTKTVAAHVGDVYAGSGDNGRLAVAVTVSGLAGSTASRPADLHPVCGPTYPSSTSTSKSSVSVVPSTSYCVAEIVAVRRGTVFSVSILSSEGPARAQAVADSFRVG